MHSFTLALLPMGTENIRSSIASMIAKYDRNLYWNDEQYEGGLKQYLPPHEIAWRLRFYKTGHDLHALAATLNRSLPWQKSGIDEQGFWSVTQANVIARWDGWGIGGNYDGLIYSDEFHQKCMDDPEDIGDNEYLKRNIRLVSDILTDLSPDNPAVGEADIVTPDGEWHSIADLGWIPLVAWGYAEDNGQTQAAAEKWPGIVRELLYKHLDCLAVGLDVHS